MKSICFPSKTIKASAKGSLSARCSWLVCWVVITSSCCCPVTIVLQFSCFLNLKLNVFFNGLQDVSGICSTN